MFPRSNDGHLHARHLVRAVVIVLAFVSLALLLSVDSVYSWLQGMLLTAKPLISQHPVSGAAVFVLLAAVSALLAFFSSTLLVPAAVYTWGNALTAALLWQLVLPSELPGYLCGYLGVPFRTYISAVAVAELPYAIGAVLVGDSVVNRHTGWLVALGVLAAALGYFLFRLLHRRMQPR